MRREPYQTISLIIEHILVKVNEMKEMEVKENMLTIVEYIWSLNTEELAFDPSAIEIVFSSIEKAIALENDTSQLYPIHEALFEVMRELIISRDRNYQHIYTILLASLSYHFSDDFIRNQLTSHFIGMLRSMEYFPVTRLIKCFLENSMNTRLTMEDFQFLMAVVCDEALNIHDAILLADRFLTICVKDNMLFDCSLTILSVIVKKFSANHQIRTFFSDFMTTTLRSAYQIGDQNEFRSPIDKRLLTTLIQKIIHLGIELINEDLCTIIQDTQKRFSSMHGYDDISLMKVANQLGASKLGTIEQIPAINSYPGIHTWIEDVQYPSEQVERYYDVLTHIRSIKEMDDRYEITKLPQIMRTSESKISEDNHSTKSEPLPTICSERRRDTISINSSLEPRKKFLRLRRLEIGRIQKERREKLEAERVEKEKQLEREERIKKQLRNQYKRTKRKEGSSTYLEGKKSTNSVLSEENDSQKIISEILNDIITSSVGIYLAKCHQAIHQEEGTSKLENRRYSDRAKRLSGPKCSEKRFFTKFSHNQRATALFCLNIIEEMIDEVLAGEAKSKMVERNNKRRKLRHWKRKEARRTERIDHGPVGGLDEKKGVSSAIQHHKMQIELEKKKQDKLKREWDFRQMLQRERRQKELNQKLLEYQLKQKRELERKHQEELEEKRAKEEKERRRKEYDRKKREKEKQQIKEFKKNQEELLALKDRERLKQLEKEKLERQNNTRQYLEKKYQKEQDHQRKDLAARQIQRFWRKYIAKYRPQPLKFPKTKHTNLDSTTRYSSDPTQVTVSHEAAPLIQRIPSSKAKYRTTKKKIDLELSLEPTIDNMHKTTEEELEHEQLMATNKTQETIHSQTDINQKSDSLDTKLSIESTPTEPATNEHKESESETTIIGPDGIVEEWKVDCKIEQINFEEN